MKKKKTMFWNWMRWQCLNRQDWNDGEIPAGSWIDEDEFTLQVMKLAKNSKNLVGRREKVGRRENRQIYVQECMLTSRKMLVDWDELNGRLD